MREPVIRRAGPADAEVLRDLGEESFRHAFEHLYDADDTATYVGHAYSTERIRADLADPAQAMWIVERDGPNGQKGAIGYALAGPCGLPHAEVTPDCGELKRIYFLRDHQGGGLGRALFGEVMAWLQANGPRTVWIGVWSENHGAQRFYGRHGFELAGEYSFPVGRQLDREFILRRSAESFAAQASQLGVDRHNFA